MLEKNFRHLVPAILGLLLFLCICYGLPARYPGGLGKYARDAVPIDVVILPGTSAGNAAKIMVGAGVVTDAAELVRWMVRFGIDRSLKSGCYSLVRGSAIDVALQIKNSAPIVESVTLIPGMRYWKIAETLYGGAGETDRLSAEIMKEENYPEEIRGSLPSNAQDRIAFILPETYFIVPGADKGAQVIKRAAGLWWERVGKTLPENVTPPRLLTLATLASVVEGEAKIAEERPVLAGIFLSRIDKKMRLQSCATVIYCWELRGQKKNSLTYKDLEIDSPYNTYMNDGLPPGPISMPSEASWRSAVHPQETPYLFFFATPRGNHIFSKTYMEHLKQQREEGSP